MKRRIYKSMLLLTIFSILFTSLLIAGVIYREFYNRMQQEIRNEALYISTGYNLTGQEVLETLTDKENLSRITWISSDGTVLFDNKAEIEQMDNHRNRPDIADALKYGAGEAIYTSQTLGPLTFYRSVRLADGTVLRVSTTIENVYSSVVDLIPHIALFSLPVIILSSIIANLLTKKIIVPLNNLNLENPLANDFYDELSPLMSRMAKQNRQIEYQIKKLKEKQEEFNAITENIREGIIILNSKGQIMSINKSARAIFGVSSLDSDNMESDSTHILTLSRNMSLQKAIESALNGRSYEAKFRQGENTYHLLASPVKDNPVKGIILFILDITEKENIEKIRREFSANVSHELKTPLTSISGYAELMKNGLVKPEDIPVFAERIYNEAIHLISLVENIIQISRLDEKNVNLPFEEIDLLELSQAVAKRLTPIAQQKQISLSVSGEKAIVSGVRHILEEMVYNLCDNAIKYNKENGKVDVSVTTTAEDIILSVADTGSGIPNEHHDRVFERFYRIDKSHSRDTGGTGLGLSIVKHSAEFHNAKIKLSSEPDKGTTVTVIFKKMGY